MNDLKNIKIVYNIGISGSCYFDEEIIKANPKIDAFLYDHTIKGIKNNSSKLHWKKIGLRAESEKKKDYLLAMKEMIFSNGHVNETELILEIDYVGCE